ncbi:MAG TPA: helix-turn-helix domain-containing protein, partial [Acetobacteraceae bacterium]
RVASFNRAMVQLPGLAHRISAEALRDKVQRLPVLRRLLLRAVQEALAQIAQTAACNSRHGLTERCARWLLMAHDRIDGDDLPLRQEFLSIMLAVRRPGVTMAIGALQAAGHIQHHRGRVVITNRTGLESATCECYARLRNFQANQTELQAV